MNHIAHKIKNDLYDTYFFCIFAAVNTIRLWKQQKLL